MASIFNENENSGSNDGIRSKFQYRIKLIKKNKYQKKSRQESEQQEFVKEIIDKIREVKRSTYTVRYKKGLPTKTVVTKEKSQQVKGNVLVDETNIRNTEEEVIVITEEKKGTTKVGESEIKVVKDRKQSSEEEKAYQDEPKRKHSKETDDFVRGVITEIKKTSLDRKKGVSRKGIDNHRQAESENSKDEGIKTNKVDAKTHEDYIKGVLSDIKRTAGDRNYGIKKKGIASVDKNIPIDKEVTRYGRKKHVIDENHSTNREREEYKAELAISIVNQMKKNFKKKKNELEVLESELYEALGQTEYELEKEKVEEIKRRIEEILRKIEEIKKQYNIFRDNYCLEDVLDIDNPLLLDNIIQYKYLVDSSEEKMRLVEDYKLMDEFQSLYAKLEEINYLSDEVQLKNEEKLQEIEKRDAKHAEVKDSLVRMDLIEEQFEYDLQNQDEYLKQLLLKIDKIDSHEYTKYKMEGLNILFGQMIKYMGLLMISPLAGMLPMIAIDTLATKNMLRQLWKQFHPEVIKQVEFSAYDYDRELMNKIDDVSYAMNLIDTTLDEIAGMKESFMMEYHADIPGYKDTLDKLNAIEDKIRDNKYKSELIRQKLKKSRKINEDKLIRVRKLNKHNQVS